jgi:Ca2+-dependent lipid-binding protein
VWNESFTFEIVQGREPLQIVVMDKDTFGKDDLEGMCEFSLVNLQDQMKHDVWLDLRDENGQPS